MQSSKERVNSATGTVIGPETKAYIKDSLHATDDKDAAPAKVQEEIKAFKNKMDEEFHASQLREQIYKYLKISSMRIDESANDRAAARNQFLSRAITAENNSIIEFNSKPSVDSSSHAEEPLPTMTHQKSSSETAIPSTTEALNASKPETMAQPKEFKDLSPEGKNKKMQELLKNLPNLDFMLADHIQFPEDALDM
eukprot:TRINITY_DN3306_c0_g1_i5.p1 TRINITY_DN3306_c0_g1~~TRINITY_DN3306_c0_g1_i5.p1  ORF type:complete len:196 (+),score=34.80 TRINITY_DN3306_c0_g1_i5:383-970(+)